MEGDLEDIANQADAAPVVAQGQAAAIVQEAPIHPELEAT